MVQETKDAGPLSEAGASTVSRMRSTTTVTDRSLDLHGSPNPAAQTPRSPKKTFGYVSFFLCVLLPFVASAIYYSTYASDQFISEARFAVRSLSTSERGTSEGTTQASTLSATAMSQDAYIVTSFIHSPELLRRLSARVDLKAFFSGDDTDYFSRLPADASAEKFLAYWSDQVRTFIDGPSGIITLYVRAFSKEAAQQLTLLITQESEKLANELSERARSDIVARAQADVDRTEADYRQVLSNLNKLQNESGFLDPTAQASETGKLLLSLMARKLEVDSRLSVLGSFIAADAPSARPLKQEQETLQDQIDKLRAEVASSNTADTNLSRALTKFSELETDRLLATGLYEAARRNLVSAQEEALRKSIYVTVFVQPSLPDESRYPRRLFTPLLLLLGLSVAWGIAALAWASVEDHSY